MSSGGLTITPELVRTMRREGLILVLVRHALSGLLLWGGLSALFVAGAVLLFNAGLHSIGPAVGAAVVIVGYPILCLRNIRRAVSRALQPYDLGCAVASSASPGRLRLQDPDTGFETQYRTRKVWTRGSTAAIEVTTDEKRGLILVPKVLLSENDVMLLRHRV